MALHKRFSLNNQKITIATQLQFLHVLQRMLSKGLTLIQSLDAMKYYAELEYTSSQILKCLEAGQHLDEAMDEAGFHHSIISYLFVVREKSNISERIEQCHQLFQQHVHYMRKFQQTVRYPLILLFIFSGLLFFYLCACYTFLSAAHVWRAPYAAASRYFSIFLAWLFHNCSHYRFQLWCSYLDIFKK